MRLKWRGGVGRFLLMKTACLPLLREWIRILTLPAACILLCSCGSKETEPDGVSFEDQPVQWLLVEGFEVGSLIRHDPEDRNKNQSLILKELIELGEIAAVEERLDKLTNWRRAEVALELAQHFAQEKNLEKRDYYIDVALVQISNRKEWAKSRIMARIEQMRQSWKEENLGVVFNMANLAADDDLQVEMETYGFVSSIERDGIMDALKTYQTIRDEGTIDRMISITMGYADAMEYLLEREFQEQFDLVYEAMNEYISSKSHGIELNLRARFANYMHDNGYPEIAEREVTRLGELIDSVQNAPPANVGSVHSGMAIFCGKLGMTDLGRMHLEKALEVIDDPVLLPYERNYLHLNVAEAQHYLGNESAFQESVRQALDFIVANGNLRAMSNMTVLTLLKLAKLEHQPDDATRKKLAEVKGFIEETSKDYPYRI